MSFDIPLNPDTLRYLSETELLRYYSTRELPSLEQALESGLANVAELVLKQGIDKLPSRKVISKAMRDYETALFAMEHFPYLVNFADVVGSGDIDIIKYAFERELEVDHNYLAKLLHEENFDTIDTLIELGLPGDDVLNAAITSKNLKSLKRITKSIKPTQGHINLAIEYGAIEIIEYLLDLGL